MYIHEGLLLHPVMPRHLACSLWHALETNNNCFVLSNHLITISPFACSIKPRRPPTLVRRNSTLQGTPPGVKPKSHTSQVCHQYGNQFYKFMPRLCRSMPNQFHKGTWVRSFSTQGYVTVHISIHIVQPRCQFSQT